jgi:hypothetical protein
MITRQRVRELETEVERLHKLAADLETTLPKAEAILAEREQDLADVERQEAPILARLAQARARLDDAERVYQSRAGGFRRPDDDARATALAQVRAVGAEHDAWRRLRDARAARVAQQRKHVERNLVQRIQFLREQGLPLAQHELADAQAALAHAQETAAPPPEPTPRDTLAAVRQRLGV